MAYTISDKKLSEKKVLWFLQIAKVFRQMFSSAMDKFYFPNGVPLGGVPLDFSL